MRRSCDVLVAGGGIAGVAAALAARAAGADVVLVRPAPGVTALASGAWHGPPPPPPLAAALEAAALAVLPVAGPLPHPAGGLEAAGSALAPHATAAFAPGTHPGVTLVCGIAGLPGFRAAALARLWADAANLDADTTAAATLELPGTPAAGWSPVALARLIDREPSVLADPLAAAVAAAVRAHRASRVILPAVLGLARTAGLLDRLQEVAAAPVAEALGTAPSVPGWRLDGALQAALAAAGVQVDQGSLSARAAPDATAWQCGALVLATGSFAGGGLSADGRLADSVLGTPVDVHRFSRAFTHASETLAMTAPDRLAPQPLLSAGLDAASLPPGVLPAGSVRRGDGRRDGLGHAAADGWHAGGRAAAHASGAGSAGTLYQLPRAAS